jgi:Flp pilus assembly protein TadG
MQRILQFLKQRDGAIAIEFAFVAPVMIAMFYIMTELAVALGARADVVNLASAGTDLIAQEKSATTADMSNVFKALSAMLYPYDVTNAIITISSITDDKSGGAIGNDNPTGNVAWSCSQGGTKLTTYTFPPNAKGLLTSGKGGSVIVTIVKYNYVLPFSINFPGLISFSSFPLMTSTFFEKPRRATQIPLDACPSGT